MFWREGITFRLEIVHCCPLSLWYLDAEMIIAEIQISIQRSSSGLLTRLETHYAAEKVGKTKYALSNNIHSAVGNNTQSALSRNPTVHCSGWYWAWVGVIWWQECKTANTTNSTSSVPIRRGLFIRNIFLVCSEVQNIKLRWVNFCYLTCIRFQQCKGETVYRSELWNPKRISLQGCNLEVWFSRSVF